MTHYASAGSTNQYLEARVTTASQPELQLMLLDGAIRFATLARSTWEAAGTLEPASAQLARSMDIVEELIRAVGGGQSAISKRLEEEYAFIYRNLAACRRDVSLEALTRSLSLLTYQRETWKQVCEKLRQDAPQSAAPTDFVSAPASKPVARTIPVPTPNIAYDSPATGFSFTA